MADDENTNKLPDESESTLAEKLAQVISVILPKMIRREIEKDLNIDCHNKKINDK